MAHSSLGRCRSQTEARFLKMKWRHQSAAILLCGVFALANSSPAGKKDLLDSGKRQLEKTIDPAGSEAEDTDDLLARAKKSSTTTFCVEIKPGNEQPAVVVCDPSKSENQVPIPTPPPPPPPAPQPEAPNYYNPPLITDLIPEYQRDLQPALSYEPLIYVPQMPQIIPPPYQSPQVIVLRDPSCPSSNPSIISSLSQPGHIYPARSLRYPIQAANLWRSSYDNEDQAMKSVPVANTFGGMFANGFSSPLSNVMGQRRGDSQVTNTRTLGPNPAIFNGNPITDGQYVVQCNPTLTPLPSNIYGNGLAGKANEQDLKSGNIGGSGGFAGQSQFTYPGLHGSQMIHQALHHNKGLPIHGSHHYQSNMYPYNRPYNAHYKMTPSAGGQEKSADESQVAAKGEHQDQSAPDSFTKIISGQQLGEQSLPIAQSSFNGEMNHQGVAASAVAESRTPSGQKLKMESKKAAGAGQDSENRFHSSSFGQLQSSFGNGGGMQMTDGKEQGFQTQMGFAHNQEQQKLMGNAGLAAGSQQKNSEQRLTMSDLPSRSQMLMQRMRSAVAQTNMVQPFMVQSSGMTNEKSMQMKA